MPFWKPLLLLLGAAGLVYSLADPGHVLAGSAEAASRTGAFLLALAILVFYTYVQHVEPTERSHREMPVRPVPLSRAVELQRLASAEPRLTATEARVFAFAILRPSELWQRITESFETDQQTMRQRVTIQGYLPRRLRKRDAVERTPMPTESVLLPVLIPLKGELSDKLTLTAADGSALPALSYGEYLQMTAKVLRMFLLMGYGLDRGEPLPAEAAEVERRALQRLMHRGKWVPDGDRHPADLIERLPAVHSVPVMLAAELVRALCDRYALVALVPMENGRFVVSYERTIVPGVHFADRERPGWRAGLTRWLRVLLGASPVDLTLRLDNATICKSYHLVVNCPAGLYLGEQTSSGLIEAQAAALGDGEIPPYSRFRRRAGQQYAHFYSRFFRPADASGPTPEVKFRFFEVPPGSLFRAAVAAATCFFLILLVGIVVSRATDHDPGTDAPAFLLAFPAVAATWLGCEAPAKRLFEGTLAARLSLIVTAASSVAASGLFMFYSADTRWPDVAWPGGGSVLGITEISWSALALLAFLNAFIVVYMSLRQTCNYNHLCSYRPGPRRSVELDISQSV